MPIQEDKANQIKIDQIKVGSLIYKVKELSKQSDDCGRAKCMDCEILVRDDIHPQMVALTLLHETIHVMLYQAGVNEHEETLVVRLTGSLMSLIRDNPQLISFIQNVGY